MTFIEIFIHEFIQYEIITFEASRSWIIYDIFTNFFTHAFHIIVNNFVNMTFDLRGQWMSKKIVKRMTFTDIFFYEVIQYEIITFEASISWIIHDIFTKIFTHACHIIVNNFVKMTFDLRVHLMSEKNCLKYDLYGNFYLWNHSIWNHNFQSF